MKKKLGVNLRAKPAVFSRKKYHFLCNFCLSHFSGQFLTKSVRAPFSLFFVCFVFDFGFEGRILVLIVPVPGHYLPFFFFCHSNTTYTYSRYFHDETHKTI